MVGYATPSQAFALGETPILDELRGPLFQLLTAAALTLIKWVWARYVEPPGPPAAPMAEHVALPGGGVMYPNSFAESLRY